VERTYTIPFVPVLLQTADYARAIFRDMEHRSEDKIGQLLEVWQRQEVLNSREGGLDPLQLVAVTHETSLRQVVGSPRTLRDQLEVLAKRSTAPNVSLRVLPFGAKPVLTMTCMYAYFEYKNTELERDVVHIETHAGYWSISDPDKVEAYRKARRPGEGPAERG
jgi:hypothetical protein